MNRQAYNGSYANSGRRGAIFAAAPVTKWLMLALVIGFLVDSVGMSPGFGRLKPSLMLHSSVLHEVWRWVSYVFVDVSLGSWIFSLFVLYGFGRILEPDLGSRRYAVFLGYCVLCGAIVYLLVSVGQGAERTLGLSGASSLAYGVLVMTAIKYPVFVVKLMIPPVELTLKTLVLLVIGAAVVMMIAQRLDSAVSLAHLSGVAVAWIVMRKQTLLRVGEAKGGAKLSSTKRRTPKRKSKGMRPRTELNMQRNKHEAEVDEILEKVSAEGIGNLTEREREILKFASKK